MASTLTSLLVHVVFSTKNREAMIPERVEAGLHAYMGGICRGNGSRLMAAGGVEDHRHLFVSLGKSVAVADLVMEVKRDSSSWMKENGGPAEFGWQDGYAAFTIGRSQVEALVRYIAGQRAHHATVSFQDELRAILRKYEVECDERYVWG